MFTLCAYLLTITRVVYLVEYAINSVKCDIADRRQINNSLLFSFLKINIFGIHTSNPKTKPNIKEVISSI